MMDVYENALTFKISYVINYYNNLQNQILSETKSCFFYFTRKNHKNMKEGKYDIQYINVNKC